MGTIELQIEGMSCAGCGERLEAGLAGVDGVRSARADHEAGRVRVEATETDEAALRAAVEELGYEVVGAEPA